MATVRDHDARDFARKKCAAQLWLPLTQTAGGYQSALDPRWRGSGQTTRIHDAHYSAPLLHTFKRLLIRSGSRLYAEIYSPNHHMPQYAPWISSSIAPHDDNARLVLRLVAQQDMNGFSLLSRSGLTQDTLAESLKKLVANGLLRIYGQLSDPLSAVYQAPPGLAQFVP